MKTPIPLKAHPLIGAILVAFWSLFDWFEELSMLVMDTRIEQVMYVLLSVFYLYVAFIILSMFYKLVSSLKGRMFIGMLTTLYLSHLALQYHYSSGVGFIGFMAATILFFTLPLVQTNLINHAT